MSILTARRKDMAYCPGCSHGLVLEQLDQAIERLGLPLERICIVSDIGCIGIADRYFACHTFHGLHGRSITYAEGIHRVRPDMLVVVLIGDGGCGIGTAHLVHAARRRAGIKVVVCNNFNFGMTGGQHSPTTPECTCTTTTPDGAADQAFDVCETVAVNGASYVARHSALDPGCVDSLEAALRAPGFALVDLWELCVAYFMPSNDLKPQDLLTLSQRTDLPFGVLRQATAAESNRQATRVIATAGSPMRPGAVGQAPRLSWPGRTEISVAGSAGQRIRSAVATLGEIAVAGGLFAAEVDDFPITVRRGHSVSNLVISPRPIRYPSVDNPDLLVLLSADGVARAGPGLASMRPSGLIVVARDLEVPTTPARVVRFDFAGLERQAGKASAAVAAVAFAVQTAGWARPDELQAAAEAAVHGSYRGETLRALATGFLWTPAA